MRLTFLTLFIFFTIIPVLAQSADWKELYIRVCGADEEDAADILRIEEESEALEAVADNPFNINAITQDELERLTFLSEQDIDAIALYLYRYGKMNSLQELQAIPQLSADKRQLLRYFVYCGEKQTEGKKRFPSGKPVHNAYYSGEVMLQTRKGFTTDPEDGGYLGSPYKQQFRYDFQYGDNLRAGII
ncbi:MAG: helix-hairpin-helix domain-containing protein, partial [Bacteroidaceae bacterium]|nr:helix-hairpin-helix domain-containing protein [Bacteroidaceae bacterium]